MRLFLSLALAGSLMGCQSLGGAGGVVSTVIDINHAICKILDQKNVDSEWVDLGCDVAQVGGDIAHIIIKTKRENLTVEPDSAIR